MQTKSRWLIVVLLLTLAIVLVNVAVVTGLVLYFRAKAAPRDPLAVRLDPRGPYLILASRKAEAGFAPALEAARALHPDALHAVFDPDDLASAGAALRQHRPRYALVFLVPDEFDVNFAWRWLTLTTQVDDDPLVDVRTGFITGATPEAAAAFVKRIAAAVHGESQLPGLAIDNLGPNTVAGKSDFYRTTGNSFIPVFDRRFGLATITHGTAGFTDERLGSLAGAGMIHLGGHGSPGRVDDGLTAGQVCRLQMAPCVLFNGACYTGVTNRWYDSQTPDGKIAVRTVAANDSFCLNILNAPVIAYLAAPHPDHGMPVYQEMEYLACTGCSLGDTIKHTHDGVILGAGGRLPALEPLHRGMPSPEWMRKETDVMLRGTAARVLFGDPALIETDAFTEPPFTVMLREDGDALLVTATLTNAALRSSYTDTYHNDLAQNQAPFNDRALIVAELPSGWERVGQVEVLKVVAKGQELKSRLIGQAVEVEDGKRLLNVQVDVASEGWMQSPWRTAGAKVELRVRR